MYSSKVPKRQDRFPSRSRATTTAIVIVFAISAAQVAQAVVIRHDADARRHEGIAAAHPEVGFWGFGNASCSGVLVTETKVLTAAHCVDPEMVGANGIVVPEATSLATFGLGTIPTNLTPNISRIQIHPDWRAAGGLDDTHDLAVIDLATPITDVTLPRISLENPDGRIGTLVGYGLRGNGRDGLDLPIDPENGELAPDRIPKSSLGATNVLQVVSPSEVPFLPFSDAFLSFDFDGPEIEHYNHFSDPMQETEGAGAPGDSGSPIYADFEGEKFIVAINSGGRLPDHLLPAIAPEDTTPELFAKYAGAYGIVGGHPLLGLAANAEFLAANSVPTIVPEPSAHLLIVVVLMFLVCRDRATRIK